ncbi:MAG: type VI secretion system-associated protein TagF [Cellvibrionaceae bacterium]|nr:type VI secretion system-associated protein TagF [Cellvibrionaceae bacterium]
MSDKLGVFGKIPAHGDFIQRNVDSAFLAPWDEWLQRCVTSSKEILDYRWLDVYLTSPIWRFVLTAGVVDKRCWAGILLPSVDSVGRYFPLSIVLPLPENTNVFMFQMDNELWFSRIEEAALSTLNNSLEVDELLEALRFSREHLTPAPAVKTKPVLEEGARIAVGRSGDIRTSYPNLLLALFEKQFSSYSLWWSLGSQMMPATNFTTPALPQPNRYSAMLDGSWFGQMSW